MNPVVPDENAVATYYGRPVLKQPVWIWTVPAYFYVGGISGAVLVLGAVAQIKRDPGLRPLVIAARRLGFIGQAVGSVLLIADLGKPSRFLNMLRVFRPLSPLSMGSWVLAVGGALSGLASILPQKHRSTRSLSDVSGLAAGALGIPLAGYTGVLLANSAIPVWQGARHSLPALFVSSSVASCASLFEMMELSPREQRIVHRFGVIGKTAELICITAMERQLSEREAVVKPLRNGVAGALWTVSKVLTVASLALTLMPGQSKARRTAGVLGTIAGIGLRFAVFQAGFASSRNPKAVV